MNRAIVIMITIFLISLCSSANSQSVILSATDVSRKPAMPGDLVTVPFSLKSDSPDSETFLLEVVFPDSISAISRVKEITVAPGEKKIFALTFLIGASRAEAGDAEVKVIVQSVSRKGLRAETSAIIGIEARECAEISGLPDVIESEGGNRTIVRFSVKNCGFSRANFDYNITTSPELTLYGKPEETVIEAGSAVSLKFPVIPSESYEDYLTHADIVVLSRGKTVTFKTVTFNVARHTSEWKSNDRQYIPVNMKLEYKIASGRIPATALKFMMPTFVENSVSMKSETWVTSGEEGFRTSRSKSEFGYGDNSFSIGNQETGIGSIRGESRELKGWKYSRNIGMGSISYLKGGDATGEISEARIERAITDRITIGAGRSQTHVLSAVPIDFKTYSAFSNARVSDAISLYSEFVNTRSDASGPNSGAGSGTAFRLSGAYRKNNLVINALTQKGSKGFGENGFRNGSEIETVYKNGKSSFYLGAKKGTAWNYQDIAEPGSSKSYKYESRRAGWSLKKKKPGMATNILIGFNKTNQVSDSIDRKSEKMIAMEVSKKSSHLESAVKINVGSRSEGLIKSNILNTELSGIYRWSDYEAGITRRADSNNRPAGRDRVYSLLSQISYVPERGKTSFRISRTVKSEKGANGINTRSFQTALRLDSKISRNLALLMTYDIFKTSFGRDSGISATLSRTLDFNIPYRKNGSVSGVTFIDANGNGIFDSPDTPLEGVVFRINGSGVESSSDSGRFEFVNLSAGTYKIITDRDSYPVGISPAENSIPEINIRNGKNHEISIPFEPLYRLSGEIILDSSSPNAEFSRIGIAKIRLTLKSGETVVKEAFSDESGRYYFEQVPPGEYQVEMDKEWLPRDAIITGVLRYNVGCGITALESETYSRILHGEDNNADGPAAASTICDGISGCDGLTFNIAPRQKKIVKTFSN